MVGALTDPFDDCHMGVTAENVAAKYDISREPTRTRWPSRATAAPPPRSTEGYFKEQILPIEITGKKGKVTIVDTDEHIRADVSLEDMAKLRPRSTRTARSPRATPPASTTPPRPWCWRIASRSRTAAA